jgi:hypothetical protein
LYAASCPVQIDHDKNARFVAQAKSREVTADELEHRLK